MSCLNFTVGNAGVYSYYPYTALTLSSFFDLNYFYNCLDIDECLSSPCGPKAQNNCTNFPGYHKCACGEGYAGNEKKCVGRPHIYKE